MHRLPEITFKIGISLTPGMTAEAWDHFAERGGEYAEFFTLDAAPLADAMGMNRRHAIPLSRRREALDRAMEETDFIQAHNISALFVADDEYPESIRMLSDAPLMLYALGGECLQAEHSLAMVGTRKPTAYGAAFCKEAVEGLASTVSDLCIVSGLAYGIDYASHVAALEAGVKTIAVVAHGLDMIYPAQHRDLARRIVASGGMILSEYPKGVKPWRPQFLARNRIIAAAAQGTLIVESDLRGGAMTTGRIAFELDREVMALPGRAGDPMSAGCNAFIRSGRASLVTSPADIADTMGWETAEVQPEATQPSLFADITPEQRKVHDALPADKTKISFDNLLAHTGLDAAELMAALSDLEFADVVVRYPGQRYSLK